jgi:type I restriction enzyme S subunit
LEEELSQSSLPYRVDIVNLNSISNSFREAISADLVPILWDWEEFRLSELCYKIGEGLHGTPNYTIDGQYYFINGNNLKKGQVVITKNTKKIHYDEFKKYKKDLGLNTVLLSINGTLGNLAKYNNELCILGKSIAYFNIKDGTSKIFIYYLMLNNKFQKDISHHANGSTIKNVSLAQLRSYPILIPPLPEQKAIAAVLSSLDDKIDLLHRQNKTLEAIAETIFRQWFVEEADDSWEEGKLGDEFNLTMGVSPPGSSYNDDATGTPMFQGNADFTFRFPNNRIYTNKPKKMAEPYDTLISVRAPVGDQNMAQEKCCIGRGVAAFRYKNNNNYYTYTYYKMKLLVDEIKQFNETGTVFGSISKNNFLVLEITIPTLEVVEKFQNEVKSVDAKVMTNCSQIKTLETLRDTLLPKLISGDVRVEYELAA